MPRVARFRVDAVAELMRQLRYAPLETLERQMNAAERLAAELDPQRNYPEDFIVFRITGYRPERSSEPAVLVGEALLPDLVSFIQRISQKLNLKPDHAGRRALPLNAVCERLKVSRKTIQRYRRSGLIFHYIVDEAGRKALGCFEDALERYIERNGARLARAAGFSRIDATIEARIIDEARELRRTRAVSLNEAALELAQRHGRAHETIRGVLQRHERREPIFAEPGPIGEREARVMHRAWRFGVPVASLATRFRKTATTIRRAINRRRGGWLAALDLRWIDLPTFKRKDAEEVILSHTAVTRDLDRFLPRTDAIELLLAASEAAQPAEAAEEAILAAYNLLKRRASRTISRLGAWPGAIPLDAAESDLRWATLLKRRLVSLLLPGAIRRVRQHVQRPIESHTSEEIASIIDRAVAVISAVIETVDPARGQRVEKLAALAMDRSMARTAPAETARRAAARHAVGVPLARDPMGELTGWDAHLEFRPDLKPHIEALDAPLRDLVMRRHGWSGEPPRTIAALAKDSGLTISAAARLLHRAEAELRRMKRTTPDR